MTTIGVDTWHTWRTRAQTLREELVAAGKLTSEGWGRAILDVPRHHFVPRFYQRLPGVPGWHLVSSTDPATRGRWWTGVWANTSLVTDLGEVPDGGRDTIGPVSSSSAPGLMTRMLESLDVDDGHRVLEIGTGTGYNAALLCHQLGANNVFSVDIDPQLVDAARNRLAERNYEPTLAAVDGAEGLPAHAPYDRILATCAVSRVPRPWCEQVRDGGLVLVDVKVHAVIGNLVLLRRDSDQLSGRFDGGAATFMQMRTSTVNHGLVPEPRRDEPRSAQRRTELAVQRPWEHPILWFLLHLSVPGRVEFGFDMDPDTGGIGPMFLHCRDGSWCQVTTNDQGTRHVREGGPTPLWSTLERLHELWTTAGEPGWTRFGLTVRPDRQTIWLDQPNSEYRWVL